MINDVIDINCDLGESYGHFKIGQDALIMPFITSCNIACGYHGGDPSTIQKTIDLALKHHVHIGAHPSYLDLLGFGRRSIKMNEDDLFHALIYQISAMKGMVEASGGVLHHVKPHGALYNDMARDERIAQVIIKAIKHIDGGLILYGMAEQPWRNMAYAQELHFWQEAFSDRNYTDDLFLVSRDHPQALIETVPSRLDHVTQIAGQNEVKSITGKIKAIQADTICIHGDHPLAVATARAITTHFSQSKSMSKG